MDPLQNVENMSLSSLPYTFQHRLITLAPVRIINDFAEVCPDVKKLRSFRPKAYDQVFLTNNEDVYQWASKETFLTVLFKFFYQYTLGKYIFDGESNVNPIWQNVLRVDDIVSSKQHIYIEDTLILHCDSIACYKKVIQYISGPFTRLILHGNINVAQIKRLMHPGVKKVRINAAIETPAGHDAKLAKFVAQQACYNDSSITICRYRNIVSQQVVACKRYKRVLIYDDEYVSVVKNYNYLYYRCISWPLCFIITGLYITVSMGLAIFVNVNSNTLLGFSFLYLFGLSVMGLQFSFMSWQYGFNRMDVDNTGMSQDVSVNYFWEFDIIWSLWSIVDGMLLTVYKWVIKENKKDV